MSNAAALAPTSWRGLLPFAIGAFLSVAMSAAAHADHNAIVQRCRMTVGKPIVQSCMRSGQGDMTSCRQKATPAVKRCVMRSGSMGGGPRPQAMGGGRSAGRRGGATAGGEARRMRCKELAYQRGFNSSFKDRGGVREFVKSCMQGKSF